MTNEAHLATWKDYQAAWADLSVGDRRALLEGSVAPNGVYADPAATCEGIDSLLEYIAKFQRQMPSARFENTGFVTHHDQGLSHWVRLDGNGAISGKGSSYAQFGADGRLTRMSGFPEPA